MYAGSRWVQTLAVVRSCSEHGIVYVPSICRRVGVVFFVSSGFHAFRDAVVMTVHEACKGCRPLSTASGSVVSSLRSAAFTASATCHSDVEVFEGLNPYIPHVGKMLRPGNVFSSIWRASSCS